MVSFILWGEENGTIHAINIITNKCIYITYNTNKKSNYQDHYGERYYTG